MLRINWKALLLAWVIVAAISATVSWIVGI